MKSGEGEAGKPKVQKEVKTGTCKYPRGMVCELSYTKKCKAFSTISDREKVVNKIWNN